MPFNHSNELSAWRNACLLVESLSGLSQASGCIGFLIRDAHRLAIRMAALLAEASSGEIGTHRALRLLHEANQCSHALMAQMLIFEAIDDSTSGAPAELQLEVADIIESVDALIRSLRSPE